MFFYKYNEQECVLIVLVIARECNDRSNLFMSGVMVADYFSSLVMTAIEKGNELKKVGLI